LLIIRAIKFTVPFYIIHILFVNEKMWASFTLFYFNILNADWDLGVCLEYECKRKQLFKPVFLNYWIDLRATYRVRVKGRGMFTF
jgi:hypothetical protein